jgi:threonine/homoserine/homoserine lactone efflux protein
MIATSHLPAFLLTVYLLVLIPGPSVLFTVSRGVALGRRAALATVAGNTAGLAVQLVLVVVGLGAVLARSDAIYTTLKLIGAAYLVFLGIRTIRERGRLSVDLATATNAAAPRSLATIVREGMMVGFTNPKGLIIFTAVLPQFIDRSQGHVTLQLALLGVVCVLIALLSDSTWAIASGAARGWLGNSTHRLERLTGLGGLMLVGLGVGLAVTGRKN